MNLKKITLPLELAEDAAIYASALDEIGGKKDPNLAELLLEDDEEPAAARVLRALKGAKRDETYWILGWFRAVADLKGCHVIAVLRAARSMGIKLEEAA